MVDILKAFDCFNSELSSLLEPIINSLPTNTKFQMVYEMTKFENLIDPNQIDIRTALKGEKLALKWVEKVCNAAIEYMSNVTMPLKLLTHIAILRLAVKAETGIDI